MEKVNSHIQLKRRSSRACIADGYRFFANNFRRILRATWPVALAFAVINTVGIALPALLSPQLLIIGLTVCVTGIVALLLVSNRLLLRHSLFERVSPQPFRVWLRHLGMLLLVLAVCLVTVLALSVLCALPAIIITVANWQSQMGQQIGDPSGMPAYVAWLSMAALLIVSIIQAYMWLSVLPPLHLVKASVAAQEQERKEALKIA